MAKNKRKILYLVTKSNWGGAQKYVYDFATSLPEGNFEASVALGGTGLPGDEKGLLAEKLETDNVPIHFVKSFARDIFILKEISSIFELISLFRKVKPDVIHANSSKAGGLGMFCGWLLGIKKRIFTVHGWYFNEDVGFLPRALSAFFSWLTVLFSTKTIVISRQNYDQAIMFPFVKKKFVLIYNGVENFELFKKEEARERLTQRIKKNSEGNWIGTIAELHKNKGLEYLIKSMAHIKSPAKLFIMGEGEERDSLEKIIEENRLEKKVFLLGYVSNAKKLLNAFDVFTLTSLKEGHPYTILEAGRASLPVVGSNIPGISDILENENGVLVSKKDPCAIAFAIDKILENEEHAKDLGKNLNKTVTEKFSLEKMLFETKKLY